MQDTKSHSKHFLCFEQMADIGSRILLARRASTAFLDWTLIQFIFCIEQIQLTMVCIDMTMSAIPGWIYTIKEINPTLYSLPWRNYKKEHFGVAPETTTAQDFKAWVATKKLLLLKGIK